MFFHFLWSFLQNFNKFKDLFLESRNIQTQNGAPHQWTVWPRNDFSHQDYCLIYRASRPVPLNLRISVFESSAIKCGAIFSVTNWVESIGFVKSEIDVKFFARKSYIWTHSWHIKSSWRTQWVNRKAKYQIQIIEPKAYTQVVNKKNGKLEFFSISLRFWAISLSHWRNFMSKSWL